MTLKVKERANRNRDLDKAIKAAKVDDTRRIAFVLPKKLLADFKVSATQTGYTMTDLIKEWMQVYTQENPPARGRRRIPKPSE